MAEITRSEVVENLVDLVRNGGDIARIQAIKVLLTLPEMEASVSSDPFADLDAGDELAKRRNGSQVA